MEKQVGIRLNYQLLEDLDRAVRAGDYQDRSSFVREAIQEKLDPEFGMARFAKMFEKNLRENPKVRKELQKAIKELYRAVR